MEPGGHLSGAWAQWPRHAAQRQPGQLPPHSVGQCAERRRSRAEATLRSGTGHTCRYPARRTHYETIAWSPSAMILSCTRPFEVCPAPRQFFTYDPQLPSETECRLPHSALEKKVLVTKFVGDVLW